MAKNIRRKPAYQIKIAKERIEILFNEAEKIMQKKNRKKDSLKLANRYVYLARKIGMRYNVKIKSELRKKFCRKCLSYLKPGITAEQKLKKGFINIKCLKCGRIMRYPYKK